jgi:hypothetical protein
MLWDFEQKHISLRYMSWIFIDIVHMLFWSKGNCNYGNIMSGRSGNTSNIILTRGSGGSDRQQSSSLPNGVKFAGEESKDRMYEPKHTKKLVRVLTVVAYVFSVSLAAIMLSFYYVFLWNPKDIHHRNVHPTTPTPIVPPDTACPHTVGANLLEQKAQGKQKY